MAQWFDRYNGPFAVAGLVAGLALAIAFARTARDEARPATSSQEVVLGIITLWGVWAAVPDTEIAVAVLAMAIALAVFVRPALSSPAPWMVVVMWIAAVWYGAAGLTSAWVAALGCVGCLPAVVSARRSSRRPGFVAPVVIGHAVVVVIASRLVRHLEVARGVWVVATMLPVVSVAVWLSRGRAHHQLP